MSKAFLSRRIVNEYLLCFRWGPDLDSQADWRIFHDWLRDRRLSNGRCGNWQLGDSQVFDGRMHLNQMGNMVHHRCNSSIRMPDRIYLNMQTTECAIMTSTWSKYNSVLMMRP
jgi:hypothetical protein